MKNPQQRKVDFGKFVQDKADGTAIFVVKKTFATAIFDRNVIVGDVFYV